MSQTTETTHPHEQYPCGPLVRTLIGPYTILRYPDGFVSIWRHGWRDGHGIYDRARNVVGGHNALSLPRFDVRVKLPEMP